MTLFPDRETQLQKEVSDLTREIKRLQEERRIAKHQLRSFALKRAKAREKALAFGCRR